MNENRKIAWIAGSILLLLGGGAYYLFASKQSEPSATTETPLTAPAATPTPDTSAEPVPDHYPLPLPAADATPLPSLAESDGPFATALAELSNATAIATLLVPEQLIRRLVVTIDNLPRERIGMNDRIFKRVPNAFLVKSRDGSLTTSPINEERYLPLLAVLKSASAESSAKLYLRFHPLFDKAYRELGNPDRNFNDRLVQVIDHLLATPYMEGPIELVQPKVFYQFADPKLEALSAGQKMLLRMGTVNAAQLKSWLKSFRAAITGAAAP